MIRVEHLGVRAGGFALEDLCFEIPSGAYAVLMGRTGAGKTTLLEALCGLKPASGGAVWLNGRDVTRLRPAERGIGYVPQDRALFPTKTVRQHLSFAPEVRGLGRDAIDRRVGELSRLLGLERLLDRLPRGLSGGEAQRTALGRALAVQPAILCLDEPLGALDEESRSETQDLLRSMHRATGVTILHVTHHAEEARRLATVIFFLNGGKLERAEGLVPGTRP